MNRGAVRTLVRTYLNEPQAAFWTNATLNTLINVATRKVHILIKNVSRYHFTTRVTFPTVAGSEWYQLPSDCKDIKHVSKIIAANDNQEAPLTRAPSDNAFAFTDSPLVDNGSNDNPNQYWIMGTSMRLIPKPTSVVTIRIYYEARIADMTDDANTPACDEDYHDMIAKWAAIEAASKDEKMRKDIVAMFSIRQEDLLQDVFHRMPAPPTEVEGYLQGI
ncbi:MAG: hypothetical protein K0S79_85 [Nitrospira sp.]|jgi:hypothetical protein|nr:hypothetical protein [Nitrospira sp.]